MGLIDQAKADIQKYTTNKNDFGVDIKLTAPTHEIITIAGLHTAIRLSVSTEGLLENSKKAHITFSEKLLTDGNYPVRNSKGEVSLKDHLADVKDSTGTTKHYKIQQWFPDETIGTITCMLGDYE